MESLATQMMGCKGFSKEQASAWPRLADETFEAGRALYGAAADAMAVCATDIGRLHGARPIAHLAEKRYAGETRGETGVT